MWHHGARAYLPFYCRYTNLESARRAIPGDSPYGSYTIPARGCHLRPHAIGEQSAGPFLRKSETDGGTVYRTARFIGDLNRKSAAISRACGMDGSVALRDSNMQQRLSLDGKAYCNDCNG